MSDYKAVRSTVEISRRIVFYLDMFDPQYFNGTSHAEAVRNINDILQGRSERTPEALLGELRQKGPGLARTVELTSQDIQAFQVQRELLAEPYRKPGGNSYHPKMEESNPEYSSKIIDQKRYDRAVRDGFPVDFFRKSKFDGVTFYCLPDDADLNFSVFQNCTFAVCRIRGVTFDGARIYDCVFHSCDIRNATFFCANIAHTHFRDSALSQVSFQRTSFKHCSTIDCTMKCVNFLKAALDGCTYGRVTAQGTRNLDATAITQSRATEEECRRNRASIFKALQPPDRPELRHAPATPPKHKRRPGPER